MADFAVATPQHPQRDGFLAGFGCALGAGVGLAIVDTIGVGRAAAVPTVFGLWAGPVLGFAAYAGVVVGGIRATLGPRPLARLHANRQLDDTIAGAVVSGALLLIVFGIALGAPLNLLVVNAQRKSAGASLFKVVAILAVVGLSGLAIPLAHRLRRVSAALPPLAAVPRSAVVSAAVAVALALYARHTLLHAGFETKALPIAALTQLALLPIVALVIAVLAYGPLAAARTRLPARGVWIAMGALLAIGATVTTFSGQPSVEVAAAISDRGGASRLMILVGRALLDRDRDGYSAFFRGPDCDDHAHGVNPGVKEIAGNGIDENCAYGDGTPLPAAGLTAPVAVAAVVDAGAPTDAPRLNLLIVMVDTLRADRLGASGYRRDGASISPRLDAFLAESVWFRRAYAQANNTPRSMPSFMSSRYPSMVAVDKMYAKYPRLLDDNDMLFERLQAGGYRTLGIASHFYFRPERNFTQGFTEFDNDGALDIAPSNKDVAAPRIVPKVVARLHELGASHQPFAMLVHLFEPHSSWMEHSGMPPITAKGVLAHSQRYDYEVKFVDGWIGTILDALDREKLADDTIVVVMSDHGESFGDHSFAGESMFHGTNLYDEQIRVPLAFRVPGAAPRRVDAVVQLVDLAPTVADLVGIVSPPSWVGRSIAPAIRGDDLPPSPAFAELLAYPGWDHDIKVAIAGDGATKLHHVISQRRYELYDLGVDPAERTDRWSDAAMSDRRAAMSGLMANFVDVVLSR